LDNTLIEIEKDNPELIKYKSLAAKPMTFRDCDINDPFFESFKQDYDDFARWFKKKEDKEVYVCKGDNGAYLGFLFLKPEDDKEDYSDIVPVFDPKHGLKVGTMKVESSGFRLGERFIQIIFDHAQNIVLTRYTSHSSKSGRKFSGFTSF
jgi:hypothetical protein